MSLPSISILSSAISNSLGGSSSPAPTVLDVFSVDLYSGNSGLKVVDSGIDLSTEGGMVWIKNRTGTIREHGVYDTERGATKSIYPDLTYFEETIANTLTSFNSGGHSLGSHEFVNSSARTYVNWTFRKHPRFFDVVTYTGDGVNGRTVSHNLSTDPGMVLIKRRSSSNSWLVQHRSLGGTKYLILDTNARDVTDITPWNDTDATSNEVTVGTATGVNSNGATYVMYVFAHDTAADGIVYCDTYTGNGTSQSINIGWRPQYLLIKKANVSGSWLILDTTRGIVEGGSDQYLLGDVRDIESATQVVNLTSTGFDLPTSTMNVLNNEMVYMAIREAAKPTDYLVYHSFDNAQISGSTYLDQSGNGHTAQMIGIPITGVTGQVNEAVSFNGSSSAVSIAADASLRPDDVSIAFWIDSTSTTASVLAQTYYTTGGLYYGWWVFFNGGGNAGKIRLRLGQGTSTITDVGTTSTNINNGVKRFIVATYDHSLGTAKIYVDGVLENTNSSVNKTYSGNEEHRIGCGYWSGSNQYWSQAELDEFRYYGRVLQGPEIMTMYQDEK